MRKQQRFGVNIVFFGNVWNLLRGLIFGSWDFKAISESLKKTEFGLMLVPLRGMSRLSYKDFSKSRILTFEDAWNLAKFWPAFKKLFNKRIFDVLLSGSKTGKSASGFTYIDKVAGDNVKSSEGTIIDWVLFGGSVGESRKAVSKISRLYPLAVKSSHSLLKSPKIEVREIHPEMEMEYKFIKNELKLGRKVIFHPDVESELEIILRSNSFIDYLQKSNLIYCLDIFHALQRGSRDGSITTPVVNQPIWFNFLFQMKEKVKEVHFRLDKREVELIRSGKATEVKTYLPMCYMFYTYDCDFIYELYPDLFASVERSSSLLEEVHSKLIDSFEKTLKGVRTISSSDELVSWFEQKQKLSIKLKFIRRRVRA